MQQGCGGGRAARAASSGGAEGLQTRVLGRACPWPYERALAHVRLRVHVDLHPGLRWRVGA